MEFGSRGHPIAHILLPGMGTNFLEITRTVVRTSGVALLDTSREPRDGGAGLYPQSLRNNAGGA